MSYTSDPAPQSHRLEWPIGPMWCGYWNRPRPSDLNGPTMSKGCRSLSSTHELHQRSSTSIASSRMADWANVVRILESASSFRSERSDDEQGLPVALIDA